LTNIVPVAKMKKNLKGGGQYDNGGYRDKKPKCRFVCLPMKNQ